MRRGLGILLLAAALPCGCGKKGPPRPPLAPVTAEPPAAVARQAGDRVELLLTLPDRLLDGTPVKRLAGVRIYRLARPAPDPDNPPRPAARSAFTRGQAPVAERLGDEAAVLTPGGTLLWGESLAAAVAPGDPGAPHDVAYSARFLVKGRRWSPALRPVSLVTAPPVPAPDGLAAAAGNDGIRLSWRPADGALATAVFRGDAGGPVAFEPLAVVPPGTREFVDGGAAVGRSYVYEVRAVSGEGRRLFSAAAGPAAADMVDRFAPRAPGGLTVLERPDGVSLFWEPSDAHDLAGYRVWRRRLPDGPWQALQAEPVSGTAWNDPDVEAAAEYEYAVSALDGQKPRNESERSPPVRARIPQAPPPAAAGPEEPS